MFLCSSVLRTTITVCTLDRGFCTALGLSGKSRNLGDSYSPWEGGREVSQLYRLLGPKLAEQN